jgi:hypothetical protein
MIDDTKVVAGRIECDADVGVFGGHSLRAYPVPAHAGDSLVIQGQLYIDPGPHVGVHCTHAATSSGCPVPGWIEFAGNYYE